MNIKLTEMDFQNAADELGIEVEVIKAVSDVESRGDGFLPNGKPTILFEAHIFSSQTKHKYDISHPNISSRKWNRKLYMGGMKEYDRLNEAIKLDKIAALKSASYGKFQVMGFNAEICGWKNVESFVNDMNLNEGQHLKAFVGFIKYNKLSKYLKIKDWESFARAYNGSEYKQNSYHIKMQKEYEKYIKEKKSKVEVTAIDMSFEVDIFTESGSK